MTPQAETVVVVRDERVHWALQLATAIRGQGLRPVLVSAPMTERDRALVAPGYDRVVEDPDVLSAERLADVVREVHAVTPVLGVVTITDGAMVPAAQAARALGLGHTDPAALAVARNKHAAREVLRSEHLPVPPFALIHGPDEAASVAEVVGLPAVIKPVNGSGSTLVKAVRTVEELAAAYRTIADRLPPTGQYARSVRLSGGEQIDPRRTFLVEGQLVGREYCVDVIVRDGTPEALPLVDKALMDERYFELGFVCPPFDLPEHRNREIVAAAVDAVLALGLDGTVSHVEVIDDVELGPVIVEVNAGRPGGQVLTLLNSITAGVDLLGETLSLALGIPPPPRQPANPGVQLATLTVFAEGSGELVGLHGLSDLEEMAEVLKVIPGVALGDVLSEDVETYAVNLLVGGFLDKAELRSIHDEAAALVRLELAPPDAATQSVAAPAQDEPAPPAADPGSAHTAIPRLDRPHRPHPGDRPGQPAPDPAREDHHARHGTT